MTVRVNGVYYAVTNNNGAWTLPAGDIQPPLANGTYDVEVQASNSAGQLAFNTTSNQLTINTAGPSVQIAPVNPSTITTPLGSIAIQFSKPVNGFGMQNVQLTMNGLSTPLAGATLSTSDNQNWTLGNIAGLTAHDGTYQLKVNPQGWGITDNSATPLTTVATGSWTVAAGTLVGNPSGNIYRIVVDGVDPTKANVYINNAGTPAYTAALAELSQWTLNAKPGDQLTVDFSNGNPLPAGGLTFSGASGNSGDDLLIAGTSGNDAVTVSPTQIVVNGAAAMNYSNVAAFEFNLGLGQDTLAVNGAAVQLNQDNAISSGTAVTVSAGGLIDLGGMTDTVASETLVNGQILDGTLNSGTNTLQSGTIGATLGGTGSVTQSGSGTTTLTGANSYSGGTSVTNGTLTIDVASGAPIIAPNANVSVSNSATLELAGSISALGETGGNLASITNDSTATDGVLVSGNNQVAGDIDGTGNLVLAAGSDLTATSIIQNSLVIGAGATLTIAPSGGSMDASAAAANAGAANAAATSTLSQNAIARLAAVRAARLAALLAASSAPAGDAGGSYVADAAPAAAPVAISTNVATPATSAALVVATPETNAIINEAVVPAVATTAVVVPTEIPVVVPAAMPSAAAALTVSPTSLISQPAASLATAPMAANAPTTATISDSIATHAAAPIGSVAQLIAQLEISSAIPDSMQIVAGKSPDAIADPSGRGAVAGRQRSYDCLQLCNRRRFPAGHAARNGRRRHLERRQSNRLRRSELRPCGIGCGLRRRRICRRASGRRRAELAGRRRLPSLTYCVTNFD